VQCELALFSPSTGIIDSHAYLLSLRADLEAAGGTVVCSTAVSHATCLSPGFELVLDNESGDTVTSSTLVNSAGLWASDVATRIRGLPAASIPATRFAKGHYYSYSGKSPFSKLVYPLPGDGGLGIHVTLDSAGLARFGPDVEWVDDIDYSFDERCRTRFVAAIRQYFPALNEEKLVPAYTGIRPKLSGPGEPAADFVIAGEGKHGVPGLVNLFGIESPGLTASLAIGEQVAGLLA
jgi:L-2-hydroxyglutarate oxidase LhgO